MSTEEKGEIADAVNKLLELLKLEPGHIESLGKRVDRLGKEEGLALNQTSIEKLRNHFLAVKNKLKTRKAEAEEQKRVGNIKDNEEENLSKAIKEMKEHFKIINNNIVALDIAEVYLVVKEEDQNIINKLEDVGVITNGNLDLEEYKKPENKEKADKILLEHCLKNTKKNLIKWA